MDLINLATLVKMLGCAKPSDWWFYDDCLIDDEGIHGKPLDKQTAELLIGDEWAGHQSFKDDIALKLPCTLGEAREWMGRNGFVNWESDAPKRLSDVAEICSNDEELLEAFVTFIEDTRYKNTGGENPNLWGDKTTHQPITRPDCGTAEALMMAHRCLFELLPKIGGLRIFNLNDEPIPKDDIKSIKGVGLVHKDDLKKCFEKYSLPLPAVWFSGENPEEIAEPSNLSTEETKQHENSAITEMVESQNKDDTNDLRRKQSPAGNNRLNIFQKIKNLEWGIVRIDFVEPEAVQIFAGDKSESFTYVEMGCKDGRKTIPGPDIVWKCFQLLAVLQSNQQGTPSNWGKVLSEKNLKNLKKHISDLRKRLKKLLGIDEDPIKCASVNDYVPVFQLTIQLHVVKWALEQISSGEGRHDGNTEEEKEYLELKEIEQSMSQLPYQ